MNRPLVLIILDGWGYAPPSKANAIALARKPNYDRLLKEFPNTLIQTSGRFVGLPTGQMGNSEVGHLNIGAGRVVSMDISKIDLMIEDGGLYSNPVLLEAIKFPYFLEGVPGPGFLPLWVSFGIIGTGLVLAVKGIRPGLVTQEGITWPEAAGWRRVGLMVGALAISLQKLRWRPYRRN